MPDEKNVVTLKEAREQVEVALGRLVLLYLSFSKTLVEQFGEEKGKGLILKSIMEYSARVVERMKRKKIQRLPWYGHHKKFDYKGKEYRNMKEIPGMIDGTIDHSAIKAFGCIVNRIAKEYGEEDLGCLYCYTDPGIAMATDPTIKMIHKSCEPCGDDFCTFAIVPTTEKEQKDFKKRSTDWKYVDPYLLDGAKSK